MCLFVFILQNICIDIVEEASVSRHAKREHFFEPKLAQKIVQYVLVHRPKFDITMLAQTTDWAHCKISARLQCIYAQPKY